MAIITSTVRVGQKPPKDVIKEVKRIAREVKKHPDTYDPDCPPSTPEALAEFAAMAREIRKNRRNPAPVVALRLKPDVLSKYKALGKGYTSIMADVLKYVADNPEILSKART
ncbi:MAG: BrnA antitoxin family protein [Treponema sp.]|jgi:uncharacterized protein (DUF4415 family)|nr:BrnA antitoxin family protein [Treponema sp.]